MDEAIFTLELLTLRALKFKIKLKDTGAMSTWCSSWKTVWTAWKFLAHSAQSRKRR
jgi:hypothetical protein